MTQVVEFPGLGFSFTIDRVAFHLPEFLGGRPVYWYGILIALGFFLAVVYVLSRVKSFGLDADRVFDVLIVAIITGIIGARLYYVAFSWDDFRHDLWKIFRTWEGGLAIYGGIIFGILGGLIASKIRKVKFLPLLDLAVGGIFIGQSIGRWGNFINVEAFGGNTTLPWGMTGPTIVSYLSTHKAELEAIGMTIDPNVPVHPTFLYESLWCLIGFLLILFLTNRRRFDGELSLVYLGWYGLGRAFIEGLRTDSLMMGGVRISQLLAILCVIASIIALVVIFSRIRREGDPEYMMLYVNTEEGKAVLDGTYYKALEDAKKAKSTIPEETEDESETEDKEDISVDTSEDTSEDISEDTSDDLSDTPPTEDSELSEEDSLESSKKPEETTPPAAEDSSEKNEDTKESKESEKELEKEPAKELAKELVDDNSPESKEDTP